MERLRQSLEASQGAKKPSGGRKKKGKSRRAA
jgi:hypothetical protein